MFYPHRRTSLRPTWRREDHRWHFIAGGITVATLVKHPRGYLTSINHAFDNGCHHLDLTSLVQAKAVIQRWWTTSQTDRAFFHAHTHMPSDE